ncbi:MAG: fumarylacetoacetase [Cryptosporangiaceae bacterium]|nr:fumarylacetoacetase [Cryptosporangiaceae bacterium]
MTWVVVPEGSPFGVRNLPYGVVSVDAGPPRPAVRVGDQVLPLAGLTDEPLFAGPTLNPFLAAGPDVWAAVRERVTSLLTDESDRARVEPLLIPIERCAPQLPMRIGDYVDFYSSEHHATNVGRIFRPNGDPLLPNWKHLPVGYHGRAGTVVVSGTDIVRPSGQLRAGEFGPSRRLDIEAEVGFVVGVPSEQGSPVPVGDFASHVFGAVLVNDWSARDIQSWEYVPLGPFLGKSFATSVSPWIVPLAALEAARVPGPPQDPEVLPYLRESDPWGLDLALEVRWNSQLVSSPPFAGMYWSPAQQLAHLTVNGASIRTGDLYASGTVSGPDKRQRGSFLELTWGGAEPVRVGDGQRTFLEDGDEVAISATAPGEGGSRIGFGEVTGRVVPAKA